MGAIQTNCCSETDDYFNPKSSRSSLNVNKKIKLTKVLPETPSTSTSAPLLINTEKQRETKHFIQISIPTPIPVVTYITSSRFDKSNSLKYSRILIRTFINNNLNDLNIAIKIDDDKKEPFLNAIEQICLNYYYFSIDGVYNHKHINNIYKEIEMMDIIGEFGSNYWKYKSLKSKSKNQQKRKRAVYSVKKVQKLYAKQYDLKQYELEINALKKMNHTNIIRLFDVFENQEELSMVYEYCDGKDLSEWMDDNGALDERTAKKIFKQMIKGLICIHNLGIIHKNIKPESIWFKYKSNLNPSKKYELVLFNFELMDTLYVRNRLDVKNYHGSITYFAPEMIEGKLYSTQCDMWSAGCVLYQMFVEQAPFYDENENFDNLYKEITNCKYDMTSPEWDDISGNAKDLIQKLLKINPNQRLSAKQAIKHPWLM